MLGGDDCQDAATANRPMLSSSLDIGPERNGGDHSIGGAFAETGIAAQFVDGAGRGKFLAPQVRPTPRRKFQYFACLANGFVDRVARREYSRHIGKRHAIATVG